MKKFNFNIGATVYCTSGKCGTLQKVVVDPDSMEVTDLVVEKGFLLTEDRIVPVDDVERTTDDYVMLSISEVALKKYPKYEVQKVDEVLMKPKNKRIPPTVYMDYRVGFTPAGQYIPVIHRKKVHVNINPEQEVIERGTIVRNRIGEIGEVDHMLVDAETGVLSHIVINPGIFAKFRILPISRIQQIDEQCIILDIDDGEIDQFPEYSPRPDDEIIAELRKSLKGEPFLDKMEISVENSVLTMEGDIPDIATKRHLEHVARNLRGVVDVKNKLQPENVLESQVMTALAQDPVTQFSVIEVIEDRGIVTLKGKVDSVEILKAAIEIAEAQPGVIRVINGLSVESDEYTPVFVASYTRLPLTI